MAQHDYSKGKLYKLVSDFTEQVYVGGTIQELSVRKSEHETGCDRWINEKPNSPYVSSFELLKLGECRIELLENFPCNNRRELDERERYWIENTPNCVNKVIPFRTAEELRERRQKYKAENYILNKESISQSKKEYYILNKERILESKKEYYILNKERILESRKENYILNREKSLQRVTEKITCECGVIICRGTKARHSRTQKHIEAIKTHSAIKTG